MCGFAKKKKKETEYIYPLVQIHDQLCYMFTLYGCIGIAWIKTKHLLKFHLLDSGKMVVCVRKI